MTDRAMIPSAFSYQSSGAERSGLNKEETGRPGIQVINLLWPRIFNMRKTHLPIILIKCDT